MNIIKYVEKHGLDIKPSGIDIKADFINNLQVGMKGLLVKETVKEKKVLEIIILVVFGGALIYAMYKGIVSVGFLCLNLAFCFGALALCNCFADYLLGSSLLDLELKQAVYIHTNYKSFLYKFIPITDELAKSSNYLTDKKRIEGRINEWKSDINSYDYLLFEFQGHYFCLRAESSEFTVSSYDSVIEGLRKDLYDILIQLNGLVAERTDTVFKLINQTGLDVMSKMQEIEGMLDELGEETTPEIDNQILLLKESMEKLNNLNQKLNILK